MSSSDWTDLGDNIRDMVDNAVNSRDFRQLNENISRTVMEGLEGLGNLGAAIRGGMGQNPGAGRYWNGAPNGGGASNGSGAYPGRNAQPGGAWNGRPSGAPQNGGPGRPYPGNAPHPGSMPRPGNVPYPGGVSGRVPGADPGQRPSFAGQTGRNQMQNTLFARTFGSQAGGTALMAVVAVGYTIAGVSAVVVLIMVIVGFVMGWTAAPAIAAGIFSVLLAGAAVMAWKGTAMVGRVRRFRKYVEGLSGRTYCSVKELAEHLGRSEKYVKNDLRRLIRSGWFRQGHLDRMETCLIVSDETYMQYEQSQKQLEMRQRAEQENRKRVQQETAGLSDEVKAMIRTGEEYIRRIQKSNDAIPGEEISNKISYMQTVVEKIFQRVKESPECADDLRKFMDYYLPTTVKLLDAYEELDRQPVQGENISNSKKEIEKTLDTLNLAFEKLLDSLFEETAWDVSTDISVLHTMLAQEGLTESGMKSGTARE